MQVLESELRLFCVNKNALAFQKKIYMKGLLLLSLFVVSIAVNCTFSSSSLYDFDTVMGCFFIFPFNETIASHTLVNLKKALQLYAFRDIAKRPPSGFDLVDLDAALDDLATQRFSNDFEFQTHLRRLLFQLRDAHTAYYAPLPFQFTFMLPFSLFTFVENGTHIVEVSDVLVPNASAFWPFVSDLIGARVVNIDGIPAVKSIESFSMHEIGLAKDPQVRFNIAFLERPPLSDFDSGLSIPWRGLYTFRPHHFATSPSNASVTFDFLLKNGTLLKDFSVSWKASPPANFANLQDYIASYSVAPDRRQEKAHLVKKRIVPVFNSTIDGVGFYLLDDLQTLVWYQNNFGPSDRLAYLEVVVVSLLAAQQKGVKKLILDFSMNGGGDLCLGRAMLSILFPNSTNFPPTDMPSVALSRNLSRIAKTLSQETPWTP